MDKVVATILVLFLAFLVQYLWQIYRVPQLEALLEDIEAPEALKEHTKEFEEATVVKVCICILLGCVVHSLIHSNGNSLIYLA